MKFINKLLIPIASVFAVSAPLTMLTSCNKSDEIFINITSDTHITQERQQKNFTWTSTSKKESINLSFNNLKMDFKLSKRYAFIDDQIKLTASEFHNYATGDHSGLWDHMFIDTTHTTPSFTSIQWISMPDGTFTSNFSGNGCQASIYVGGDRLPKGAYTCDLHSSFDLTCEYISKEGKYSSKKIHQITVTQPWSIVVQ